MSLEEALKLSAGLDVKEGEGGASDVSNYVKATHGALEMLATGGLTLDVVKAAHAALLQGGRGGGLFPGEFRRVQNYVCPPGVALADAGRGAEALPYLRQAAPGMPEARELASLVQERIGRTSTGDAPFLQNAGDR